MTLIQRLQQYNRTMLPLHMPGHKRNTALSGKGGYLEMLCADCDITEIAGFDNLAESCGILEEIKERAARLWKSDRTELLVNGSTVGILASIYAAVPKGGTVIAARNCHKSVYNGLSLVQAKTVYLMPETDAETGICGRITSEQVSEALTLHPEASLVILTSPTYEGVVSDIETICAISHAAGVPVLVDSAHGAHYGFGAFPKGAVACGADLVVQSFHKTLPSLTQTALLHYRHCGLLSEGCAKRLEQARISSALNLFQTSSPSYLLLASIEGCIDLLEHEGRRIFSEWEEALSCFWAETKELKHLKVLALRDNMIPEGINDKLVVSVANCNLTGPQLMDRLRREYRMEPEMCAERYCIAMTGPGDTKESLQRFAKALCEIDATLENKTPKSYLPLPVPKVVLPISEASECEWENCYLSNAVGRVSAETVFAYPPGIPLLVMGERITKEVLEFFSQKEAAGLVLHGCNGEIGRTLRVRRE